MLAVTGITGHTGKHFINELIKIKYSGKIRCFVHNIDKATCIIESGLDYEIYEGSLDNETDIHAFLSGVDTVLHIANIHFSPDMIRIGEECGVKRFILVHTTGIFSKFKSASSEYIDIEKQVIPHMQRLNITILRPTMIFGDICDYNISKFIRLIDQCPITPLIEGGHSLIQPVNARDLARAYVQVLMSDQSIGKAYNLSGERAISIRELYGLIGDMLHKKRVIISFPMKLCIGVAKIIRKISSGKIDLIEKVERMGENRNFAHDDAKADFDYTPEPFEIGLQREIEEYVANK